MSCTCYVKYSTYFKPMLISIIIKLVDCEWDAWQNGTCSESCGDGIRTNTRTKKVEAAYGGEGCSGSSNVKELCNIAECPGKYIFS